MTPAEHYDEMERWLKAAEVADDSGYVMVGNRAYHTTICLARAQVHAIAASTDPWPLRGVVSPGHASPAEFVPHPFVSVCATCGLLGDVAIHTRRLYGDFVKRDGTHTDTVQVPYDQEAEDETDS